MPTNGTSRIAVIGTGLMGSAIAEMFAASGYDVVVWNRTRDKAAAMLDKGVRRVAETAADAIREAQLVWISLLGFSAIQEALMVDEVRRVLPGKHLITQTATRPSQILQFQEFVTSAGGVLSEVGTAAVPQMVRARIAVAIYAGPELALWKPLLDTFCTEVLHQGEVGAESHFEMSMLVNSWGGLYAALFPLACMASQKVDIGPALRLMEQSPLCRMPGYLWWGEKVKNRQYDDVQVRLDLILSHVDECIEYLNEIRSPTDEMIAFRRHVVRAIELGYGQKDGAAIFEGMVALAGR